MKGSTLILSLVVMLGLILAQTLVQAKSCCPTTAARNLYDVCRLLGTPQPVCSITSGCQIVSEDKCPAEIPKLASSLDEPEEATAIQSDSIEKKTVGNVAGNPCYAECVQDCLNSCSFVGCAACAGICGMHNTCKSKINSGELEAVAMKQYCKVGCVSSVCAPMAKILSANSVADKQGSMERCNNGCSGFCNNRAAIGTE